MNTKRFILASLAVFVVSQVIEFLVHGVLLKPTYEELKSLWRPDMDSLMWLMWISGLIVSFLFTYIFIRGYRGTGLMEGARFGLIIGLFTAIPMAAGMYMMLPIPYTLARAWFIAGLLESVILAIVAALVYKPAAARS